MRRGCCRQEFGRNNGRVCARDDDVGRENVVFPGRRDVVFHQFRRFVRTQLHGTAHLSLYDAARFVRTLLGQRHGWRAFHIVLAEDLAVRRQHARYIRKDVRGVQRVIRDSNLQEAIHRRHNPVH